MRRLIERFFIKILKLLKVDLLAHAHIQLGVGHNTYFSGEAYIVTTIVPDLLQDEPKVIFDVGANIGEYASFLRKNYKQSTIHCFEPIAKTFKTLEERSKTDYFICNHFGLSDKAERANLYIASKDDDASMATAYPASINDIFTFVGNTSAGTECNFVTLDEYCETNHINQIDFLKIDVEGHELSVLKGAKKMLNKQAISIIQFEFNEFNITSKSFMIDFYKILPNYKLHRIMPNNRLLPMGEYNSKHEIFRYQNILAIKNSEISKAAVDI